MSILKDNIDDIDVKILKLIQEEFPIDERPYKIIANALGLEEETVKEKIINLYKNGYIKKIIPKIPLKNYDRYERALVAMNVEKEKIENAANLINSYENVSHNYLREHYYNVWFTVMAKNYEEIEKQVKEIAEKLNSKDYLIFKTVRAIKLNTEFEVQL
ncbi:MAG: hypothetical protein ACP5GR_01850 [Thermoplasmata archaeon]